jgi:hypothetical protein
MDSAKRDRTQPLMTVGHGGRSVSKSDRENDVTVSTSRDKKVALERVRDDRVTQDLEPRLCPQMRPHQGELVQQVGVLDPARRCCQA